MLETEILSTLSKLPEPLKQEVLHFAEFLVEKHTKAVPEAQPKKRRAGTMQGLFVLPLSEDFDQPLEEMQEYME